MDLTLDGYRLRPLATNGARSRFQNDNVLRLFSDATLETVQAIVPLVNYAGSGLTVRAWWSTQAASGANTTLQAQVDRILPGTSTITADTFAAVQTATGVRIAANTITTTDITLSAGAQIDNAVDGDLLKLRFARQASGFASDLELLALRIFG